MAAAVVANRHQPTTQHMQTKHVQPLRDLMITIQPPYSIQFKPIVVPQLVVYRGSK